MSKEEYAKRTGVTPKYPQSDEGTQFIPDDNDSVTAKFNIPEGFENSQEKHRGISTDILRKYGIRFNAFGDMLSPVRAKDGTLIGAQVCKGKRDDKGKKLITMQGSSKGCGLFGQHLFAAGGKRLVITEGLLDACSSYFMTQSKYPTVSVINGVGSAAKDIKENLDYIESFEEVIFCFDNDKAGVEKAKECANLLTPGKAKIVPLTKYKDANAFLTQGAMKDYYNIFWQAKRHQPDGIINLADIFEQVLEEDEKPSVPYPWQGLNDMLDGIRFAELVTITSGSGMGCS